MDFQRLILVSALAFVTLLLWQAWQKDYGPAPQTAPVSQVQAPSKDLPSAPERERAAVAAAETPTGQATGQQIRVRTDVLDVKLDTVGGDLREADLLAYPVSVNKPNQPFHLMNDQGSLFFIAQSGLLAGSGTSASVAPNHHAIFSADQTDYQLPDGQKNLAVRLHWKGPEGVTVTKIYTFHRGSYVVDVAYEVANGSGRDWKGHMYSQLQRSRPPKKHAWGGVYTYTGGVLYTEKDKYHKVSFDDMDKHNLSVDAVGGWVAMIQHYFLGAWIPGHDELNHYYSKAAGNDRFIIGSVGAEATVPPGGTGTLAARLYVGPKLQEHLAAVAPGLELTVDYGMLTVIAKPLFWLLNLIHGWVGNWGVAIILVTMIIKLIFYKPSEISYRSMAHMRKLQPRMAALKERFGDDRQGMQQAMMEMYKKEKINPLGGCLPIVIQIPVFIALYWMLLETVELRQAPFILWIRDLSTPDPYFVLPILMGATMLIQHRLNPTPMDPTQAKVMMILPIVFTGFFAFFPSGLVLYWVVNNTLSVLQQWYITRFVVKA